MSAEDFGTNLLNDVEEIGFDELISSLRHRDGSCRNTFGLPFLDDILERLYEARTADPHFQPCIELSSTSSTAGKTHLLYYLTAKAILPEDHDGRNACVVVLDTDGHFSVSRLKQQLDSLLSQCYPDLVEDQKTTTALTALKHVHILRPQSIEMTIESLNSLSSYLFDATSHQSYNRTVAFIALDSASASYWQARSDSDDAQFVASTSRSSVTSVAQSEYSRLSLALKQCSKLYDCPVVFTTRQIGRGRTASSSEHEPRFTRSSLPIGWQFPPTASLVLGRKPIRKLVAEITAKEAMKEADMRLSVVQRGLFHCFLNKKALPQPLQAAVSDFSGFDFRILESGVVLQLVILETDTDQE